MQDERKNNPDVNTLDPGDVDTQNPDVEVPAPADKDLDVGRVIPAKGDDDNDEDIPSPDGEPLTIDTRNERGELSGDDNISNERPM